MMFWLCNLKVLGSKPEVIPTRFVKLFFSSKREMLGYTFNRVWALPLCCFLLLPSACRQQTSLDCPISYNHYYRLNMSPPYTVRLRPSLFFLITEKNNYSRHRLQECVQKLHMFIEKSFFARNYIGKNTGNVAAKGYCLTPSELPHRRSWFYQPQDCISYTLIPQTYLWTVTFSIILLVMNRQMFMSYDTK